MELKVTQLYSQEPVPLPALFSVTVFSQEQQEAHGTAPAAHVFITAHSREEREGGGSALLTQEPLVAGPPTHPQPQEPHTGQAGSPEPEGPAETREGPDRGVQAVQVQG